MKATKGLIGVFLVAFCSIAQAAPISYYLSGVFDDPLGAGSDFLGASFTASFVYDAAAAIQSSSSATSRQYFLPMPNSWVVNVQGDTLSNVGSPFISGVQIRLVPGVYDQLTVIGSGPTGTGALANYNLINLVQTLDDASTALDSLLLPSTLFSLGDQDLTSFTLAIFETENFLSIRNYAMGNVTCFSTDPEACRGTSVPEPGALGLLALGLAGLVGIRRRKISAVGVS